MNRKRFLIALVMPAIVLVAVSGCSGTAAAEMTVVLTQIVALTPTPTPVFTPTSTPTPSPTPTPTMTPEQREEADLQELLSGSPDISGLVKEVQDGAILYLASADNEYGIEAGAFAGEYNPNVFVDRERIGCVFLIPNAAEKMLNDQLAEISGDELKFKILLPVEGDYVVNSEIDIAFEDDFYGNKCIDIHSEGNLNVHNMCPNSNWYFSYPFDHDGSKLVTIINSSEKLLEYDDPNEMVNENAMFFLQITVNASEDFGSEGLFESSFGDVFTQTFGNMISIGLADEYGTYDISIEDMVRTDEGVLIGITSQAI